MVVELSTVAVKAVAPTILKEITVFIKKKYDNYTILNNLSETNHDLVSSISKLMSVKTLLTGADTPTNLYEFFQQPELKYKDIKFCIDHIEQIKDKLELETNNLVLKGTVGQGKSIFLRSLAIYDFIENKRIPVFIELKNISKNKGLVRLIRDYLNPWIGDNEDVFRLVLKSGKISIFLDAFDEVDLDLYQETYNSIDNLTKNYPELKITITSRPETIILQNPNFYTVSLRPYGYKEQKGLIEKIVDNLESQQKLIESIRSSSFEVRSVLTTPLMVILYIKQYTFGFSVPQHVSDFYKNIFDVVTFTHDKSKGIEKRKSFSDLNQNQLEKVFERFCFESFLVRKTVFDKKLFIDLLQKSLKKNSISIDIDYADLIDDYTRFACLILKDGSEYTFIHKSIQEYYVANFITNLPEILAKEVIEKKFIKESFFRFANTNYIDFLEVLRPYYFKKYYLLAGLNLYKDEINLEFKKDDINFYKFIETIYKGKEVFDENKATCFGVNYGTSPVFFQRFDSEIRKGFTYAYERKLVDSEAIQLINQRQLDDFLLDDTHELEKIRDAIKNATFFREMKKSWGTICDEVETLLNEITQIEESVLNDEFDDI